jgi:uncharacterized membrane protein (UPF0136 family)
MLWLNAVVGAFALLNIVGGFIGYHEKHSVMSLAGGGVIGLMLIASLFLSKTNPKGGYVLATAMTVLTLAFFSMRYMTGHKIWPAGVMVVSAVAVLACLVAGHFASRHS